MRALVALALALLPVPALAQHAGHAQPPAEPAERTTEADAHAEHQDHAAMDHGAAEEQPMQPCAMKCCEKHGQGDCPMDCCDMECCAKRHEEADGDAPDHDAMDHGTMDHGAMVHAASAAPIPEAPPPPSAGSGPPRAADAIWGAEAMRESREELRRHHGGQRWFAFTADRLEYRAREGEDGYLWDIDWSYGGDIDRLWVESEGEGAFGEDVEEADISLLYGRAIGPWFDVQAGVRQGLTGPTRTYLDIGVQGTAPYFFEIEADAFMSDNGDLTAVAEVELDQRVTQRLILQPRVEIALSAQDVPDLGIGAGVDSVEAGLRLRYEIAREFAPYIGVEYEAKLGGSADFARAAGEDPDGVALLLGVRAWF